MSKNNPPYIVGEAVTQLQLEETSTSSTSTSGADTGSLTADAEHCCVSASDQPVQICSHAAAVCCKVTHHHCFGGHPRPVERAIDRLDTPKPA